MPTTIKLKNSVTTTNAPSSLAQGEVAINITDKKVWVGNAATTPIQLLGDGGSASFTSIAFGAGTVSSPSITFTGDTNTGIYSPAADTIAFTEGGVESMRINSSGSLLIGTTSSPSSAIKIYTSDGTINSFYGYKAGGVEYIGTYSNHPLGFATNNTERMRIDSSGNVLIGTTSAATSSTLNVVGTGYQPIYVNTTISGGGGAAFSRSGTQAMYVGTGGSSWLTGSSTADGLMRSEANMLFAVGNAEHMRITSGGDVCINRTSSLGSAKLHVTNAAGNANNYVVSLKANATSVDVTMIAFYDGSEDFCGQIYITPASNTTTYATSSDYRLKDNVAPMTGALAKVQALNPVTYTWKKSGKNGQGFIAHELQEIVPECVIGEKDAVDKEGKILPQMVDTSFLVATLTAAIQEQQAMIEELKAKVTALENK